MEIERSIIRVGCSFGLTVQLAINTKITPPFATFETGVEKN